MVIEDLISTGGSSLKAVEAIRAAGCEVVGMAAIFTYGFPVAVNAFKEAGVDLITLSNYNAMLETALETKYIRAEDLATLKEWRKDPQTDSKQVTYFYSNYINKGAFGPFVLQSITQ